MKSFFSSCTIVKMGKDATSTFHVYTFPRLKKRSHHKVLHQVNLQKKKYCQRPIQKRINGEV